MDLSYMDMPPLDGMIHAFAEQYPTAGGDVDQRSYDQGVMVGLAMAYAAAAAMDADAAPPESDAEAAAFTEEVIAGLRDRVAQSRATLLAG